ncbi:hypothetical protein DL769_005227 [Monosporascus sp. CRB-8-3]|nr:hypothetical protein DL769_005227 [Monosporascus sp. CRB-8-3]
MFVLKPGITGMCGQPLAHAALAKGHQVRGPGRNPGKLSKDLSATLKRFAKMTDIYDLAALQKAVVEGELLLLRVAERAGVKGFHAVPWNYDWTGNRLGDHETYDRYVSFCNHARASSTIKPIYGFTGTILEWELVHSDRSSADNLAAYTTEAVSEPGEADGGFYHVQSFRALPLEMVDAHGRGRGVWLERQSLGSLSEIEDMFAPARASTPPSGHHEYIGLAYAKSMMNGTWDYETPDCERWPGVKLTSFEQWLLDHPPA